jgi:hypothetical protein
LLNPPVEIVSFEVVVGWEFKFFEAVSEGVLQHVDNLLFAQLKPYFKRLKGILIVSQHKKGI